MSRESRSRRRLSLALALVGCVILALVFLLCLPGRTAERDGSWHPLLAWVFESREEKAAVQGCQNLATAIEAFMNNPANPEGAGPTQITDLVQPPFGGPSYLRKGQSDTIDPWGKQYQIQPKQRSDGMYYYLVTTSAPDGTPISQFGIGVVAPPK